MSLEAFNNKWYSTWMFSGIQFQKTEEYAFHANLHETNPAEQNWK